MAADLFEKILSVDLAAAARAAHYVEIGQAHVIERILDQTILQQTSAQMRYAYGELSLRGAYFALTWNLAKLPYSDEHVTSLEKIATTKDAIGGTAAAALFRLLPHHRKELIEAAFDHHDDFNYIQDYVKGSKDLWTVEEVYYLFDKLAQLDLATDAISRYRDLVPKIPAGRFEEFCGKFIENSSAARSVLMDGLTDLDQDLATAALKQLVLAGERRAIFALFMHLKYSRKDHALSVDDEVVRRAVRAISLPEGRWAIELGQALVAGNPEWGDAFRRFALNASPSDRLMIEILLARQQDVGEVIHSALQDLSKLSEHQISTIADSDYWKTAPANRIVDVLEMRNSRIASGVLQQASARTRELPLLRANPLDWWLDWIEECAAAEDNDSASAYFC